MQADLWRLIWFFLWWTSGIVARPSRGRSIPIERLLKIPLSNADAAAIRSAHPRAKNAIALFYRWYLMKLVGASVLRTARRTTILRGVTAIDGTRYGSLDNVMESHLGRGLIVAIPHHGHYIAAISAIVERARKTRPILIMYGDPSSHPGNELFIDVCNALWGAAGSNVGFIHTSGTDLRKCARTLKAGGVLVTLPDVFQNEQDTLSFEFLGRRTCLMLGSATLARICRATLLPVIPTVCDRTGRLLCEFGAPIDVLPATDPTSRLVADYAATKRMFSFFERGMSGQIICWQYLRHHFLRNPPAEPPLPDISARVSSLLRVSSTALGFEYWPELRQCPEPQGRL